MREGKTRPLPTPCPQLTPPPRQNYKVYCTLNNIPIDDSLADTLPADDTMDVDMEAEADQNGEGDDEDDDDDMPEFFKDPTDPSNHDTKTPSRNPKSKVALVVRAKINKVLAETELADKRSRQCDQNDFLRLLLGRLRPCSVWGLGANCCSVPQGGNSFLVRGCGLVGGRLGVGSWVPILRYQVDVCVLRASSCCEVDKRYTNGSCTIAPI